MNELSEMLEPWLKEHGYKPVYSPGSDWLEIDGTRTAVGWIYPDHVEVGTQLRTYAETFSTWYGSPYVILSPAEPDFFKKLLIALEFASKVVYNFNSQNQTEDISVPPRVD